MGIRASAGGASAAVDEITASGTALDFSGTGGGARWIAVSGFVENGGTSGDLQLQFAQNTGDASDTTIEPNSRITVWRV